MLILIHDISVNNIRFLTPIYLEHISLMLTCSGKRNQSLENHLFRKSIMNAVQHFNWQVLPSTWLSKSKNKNILIKSLNEGDTLIKERFVSSSSSVEVEVEGLAPVKSLHHPFSLKNRKMTMSTSTLWHAHILCFSRNGIGKNITVNPQSSTHVSSLLSVCVPLHYSRSFYSTSTGSW